jgi:5-(carboxyamino)imidazole ribonucleotide mutase
MPNGIPVATVALNGAKNAGILAAQMLGIADAEIANRLIKFKNDLKLKIEESAENLKNEGFPSEY